MEYDRYQKFRQETYQMLGNAKDATFELMDSVLKDDAQLVLKDKLRDQRESFRANALAYRCAYNNN